MFKNKFFYYLASIAFSLFVLSSCSEDSGTNPDPDPDPKPSPASNLMATSIDKSTINLMYTISPSESNNLFQDYLLTYKIDGGPTAASEKVVLKGTNPISIADLEEGKIYLFTLVARYTNGQVSTGITVKWSPATRFVKNNNDDIIKVYETASDFGSGLQMFFKDDDAPRVRKVVNGGDWDLGIRTVDNKIVIGSASKIPYNFANDQKPKPTYIYKDYFKANSLDDVYDSRAMNDGDRDANYSEITFDVTNEMDNKNIVFYVRKQQPGNTGYNYAKVMAKRPAGGGSFLQGSGTNRYIEFEISYQKTEGVPYAKVANNDSSK